MPDLSALGAAIGTQCFPLHHYEPIKTEHPEGDMFGSMEKAGASRYRKKSAITSDGMAYFRTAWPKAQFDEEDVFYIIFMACSMRRITAAAMPPASQRSCSVSRV